MVNESIKFHRPLKLSLKGLNLDYNKFARELSEAQYELGIVQGLQRKLQNSKLLIAPLTTKEATVSSKIEGTQSTVSDVFLYAAGGRTQFTDTPQVYNYRKAMNDAIEELDRGRCLSLPMIRGLHGTLLKNVRCDGPLGEFRKDKVWIAEKKGDPIERAIYIPPQHVFVPEYMDNLISYIEKGVEEALIKAGVAHYQFEAIHPFDDGNGRIGRLLVPLILSCKKKISQPLLYISGYFDDHREEYIESLHRVDETGDYEQWLKFFCKSVAHQLKDAQALINSIFDLHDRVRNGFINNKSPYIHPFIDFVFSEPFFTLPKVMESLNTSSRLTADRLVKLFIKNDLVRDTGECQAKAKIYAFIPLIRLLK